LDLKPKQDLKFQKTEFGKIPDHWKISKLKDYVIIKGRIGWKGLKKSEFTEEGEYIIVNGPDLEDGKINWNSCLRVPKWRYEESPEIMLKKNDILLTKDGTIGKTALIYDLKHPATVASGIFVIRSNSKTLNQYFLYFYLNSPYFKNIVETRIEGSVQSHLYQRDITELFIPIPPIDEQEKISAILRNLQLNIYNQKNQSKILEKILDAIFKSWFIDFDGVTEWDDSELGKIPKDWKIESLDDNITFLNGLALQKFRPTTEEFLPVIKIKEMKAGISKKTEKAGLHIDPKYIINNGDVLFSWSGSLYLTLWCHNIGALNQHLFKVSSEKYSKWFFYQWTKFHIAEFRRIAEGKKTSMGHIQRYHLHEARILTPPIEIFENFNVKLKPLFNQMYFSKLQSVILTKTRDTILPKLMSGEIRV